MAEPAPRSRRRRGSVSGEEAFGSLVDFARKDANVVGLILSGSRGAGAQNRFSDYDVKVIVKDGTIERYRRRRIFKGPGLDVHLLDVRGFAQHAKIGTALEWDAFSFSHSRVLVDKTGRIAWIAGSKARIPASVRRPYVARFLDEYINAVYRSLKAFRMGESLAGHLEATQSIPPLLSTVFGLEGRFRPYAKYLRWELEHRPLGTLPVPSAEFVRDIRKVLRSGSPATQRAIYRWMERSLRRQGYGRVFDRWGPTTLRFLKEGTQDAIEPGSSLIVGPRGRGPRRTDRRGRPRVSAPHR